MSRLSAAPHGLVGADHFGQAWLGRGAGVEMILQHLPQHVAAGTCDELLGGVFRPAAICGSPGRVIRASNKALEAA